MPGLGSKAIYADANGGRVTGRRDTLDTAPVILLFFVAAARPRDVLAVARLDVEHPDAGVGPGEYEGVEPRARLRGRFWPLYLYARRLGESFGENVSEYYQFLRIFEFRAVKKCANLVEKESP